jgi:hypothetical protein
MRIKTLSKPEEKPQSERFIETATALVDAGELNLIEAKEKFERMLIKAPLKAKQ